MSTGWRADGISQDSGLLPLDSISGLQSRLHDVIDCTYTQPIESYTKITLLQLRKHLSSTGAWVASLQSNLPTFSDNMLDGEPVGIGIMTGR
jgi:hypothetical protein